MRQIVRKKRRIVQTNNANTKRGATTAGVADAVTWSGKTEWFSWSLNDSIGYLLPLETPIEASCAAGVINHIKPGEMLVINRGESDSFRLQLQRTIDATIGNHNAKAVMGHIRSQTMRGHGDMFSNTPARAMSIIELTLRERERVETLSRLIANETLQPTHQQQHMLISHLEKALYEALSEVLCACDPMSMPPLVAPVDGRIAAALNAMAANPARAWRLESMAREAALSRTLFATRFKLVLGITPLEYLTDLRVQLAATLKSEKPMMSLPDIAKAVGYADESSLRRAYMRVAAKAI